MADLVLDAQFSLDASNALTSIRSLGAKLDETVGGAQNKVAGIGTAFKTMSEKASAGIGDIKTAFTGTNTSAKLSADSAGLIHKELALADTEAKKLASDMKDVGQETEKTGKAGEKSGGILSGIGGGLIAGGGIALAQAAIGGIGNAVHGLVDAALEADEIGDHMELAFRQAGLSGKELDAQLDSTTKFARKLGDQFAEPPAKIKQLSIAAASLGGATGKANEDMTKLALGIEKASDGAISGEGAIKILSRGVADPENAAALDKLTKKFPQLGDALKSSGSVADKMKNSLAALGPTFATLETQSTGIDAIAARFQNAGTEGLQAFGGGIISGLDKAGAAIANAAGGLNFEGLYETAAAIGEAIGGAVSTAVVYITDFYQKAKPIISFIVDYLVVAAKVQFAEFSAIIGGAFKVVGKVFDVLLDAFEPLVTAFQALFDGMNSGGDTIGEFIATFEEVINTMVDWSGVIIQFAVAPIKFLIVELSTVIGWIAKLITGLFSTSSGAKEAGSSVDQAKSGFEKFREILQSIQIFMAGVAGGMKGLTNDAINLFKAFVSFDLSAIKDAFTNFGSGAKQGFADGVNQKKADINSDNIVKEFEKSIEALDDKTKELTDKQLAAQKQVLLNQVAAQRSAGKISIDQEADLQAEISKLGKSSSSEKDLEVDGKKKKEKLKDIQKQIDAINRETEKANLEAGAANSRAELTEARKAQQKSLDDLANSFKEEQSKRKDADEATLADAKITKAQQDAFIKANSDFLIAQEALNAAKVIQINNEFATKTLELERKKEDELIKIQQDGAKKKIELIKSRAVVSTDDEMQRLVDLNDAEIKLIESNTKEQIEFIVRGNDQIKQADEELKIALATNDDFYVAIKRANYQKIRENVIATDKDILEENRKSNRAIENQLNTFAIEARTLNANLNQDTAERERELRLIEVDKTQQKELESAKGNERLKNAAYAKAALERYQIEKDFADSQKGLWGRTISSLSDAFSQFSSSISGSIRKSFDEAAKAQKEIGDKAKSEYEKEGNDLTDSLKKQAVSFNDFQDKVAAAARKFNDATKGLGKSFGRLFADGFKDAMQGVADSFKKTTDGLVGSFSLTWVKIVSTKAAIKAQEAVIDQARADGEVDVVAKASKERAALNSELSKDTVENAKIANQAYASVATGLELSFAASIAEGKKNIGDYTIMALDALEQLLPILSVQILGQSLANLGPIAGPIAAAGFVLALTLAVEGLKAGVRSGQGHHDGGYTGDGHEWQEAGPVHKREVVLEARITDGQVGDLLDIRKMLQSGVKANELKKAYEFYKNPELSKLVINPSGKIENGNFDQLAKLLTHHKNFEIHPERFTVKTFEQQPFNYKQAATLNNDNVISELRALRGEVVSLRKENEKMVKAQEAMPDSFLGQMNVGVEFFHDESISARKKELDIRRKAVQS